VPCRDGGWQRAVPGHHELRLGRRTPASPRCDPGQEAGHPARQPSRLRRGRRGHPARDRGDGRGLHGELRLHHRNRHRVIRPRLLGQEQGSECHSPSVPSRRPRRGLIQRSPVSCRRAGGPVRPSRLQGEGDDATTVTPHS